MLEHSQQWHAIIAIQNLHEDLTPSGVDTNAHAGPHAHGEATESQAKTVPKASTQSCSEPERSLI